MRVLVRVLTVRGVQRRPSAHIVLGAVFIVSTTMLGSCGGGSGTVLRTVIPATVTVPSTGVTDVDRIVQAAVDGDAIKLAELTDYSHAACRTQPPSPEKVGDPPKCASDQKDGTMVEALPVTGCDGGWAQPADAVDEYRAAIAGTDPAVVAVYVPAPSSAFEAALHAQYVAVVRFQAQDGSVRNVAFHITGGRVSWVENACPPNADLAAPVRAQSFLITPTVPAAVGTPEPSPVQ